MKQSNSTIKAALVLAATIISSGILTTTEATAADLAKGQTLFATRCASCHGDKGAGDGPIAAGLPAEQKPRNLQGSDMKFATTDEKFKELMKKGGAGVGLSMLMPAQSDLSDADIDNLLAFVKSLKSK
jgi:mono/diheme cytochrome c family protein